MKILFIHGAGGSSNKWREMDELLQGVPFESIDLPGHGSNGDVIAETVEEYAQRLSEALKEDVIVVGHSMGGMIGIELAARNQHVKGLVLAASNYEVPVHPKIISQLENGIFPEFLFLASYGKSVDEELMEQEKADLDKTPVSVALNDFKACDLYKNGKATIAQLSVPILAIYGDEDRLLPPNAQAEITSINESISTELIAGSGHYVQLEQPKLFANHVQAFYEQIKKTVNVK
ncbi:alpha/beta fold hydrolase [Alkalihalobacterium alkalinitrilicum]|uniref:alpha/beta fold hydrolase n=1 Tax=Alkalihalobacterium alkalinitrilicum TaxID=427920 RepID=UPI000994F2DA|nr:alpha/beta hydrolase [Alkalihalobacterium alkalinitrilicum]